MTIDEHTRHGIHTWMANAMGTELGDGLMSMLPPTGWADVATKHDLAQLEERLGLRFEMMEEGLEHRFDKIDQRFQMMDQRFEQMDQRFELSEHKVLGAMDRRLTETMRATFFALAALLLTVTTIIVSVVLATR
jgi:hypothetical protein